MGFLGLLFGCLALSSLAAAADAPPAQQEGVVVLRNGHVLAGRITPLGDSYLVMLRAGGQVRLAADQVEMCCRDLEAAYRRKLSGLSARDVQSRLALADWCLRNGLYARAADQLLAVWALDPADRRAAQLERRLLVIWQRSRRQSSGPPAVSGGGQQEPADGRASQAGLAAELLPSGALGQFTRQVQPLLINRCGSNACHGQRGRTTFRLLTLGRGRSLTHRLTQHNLRAVIRLIDRDAPQQSPLLEAARRAHGGLPQPPLGETDRRQYARLADWVRWVCQAPPQEDAAAAHAAGPGHGKGAGRSAAGAPGVQEAESSQRPAGSHAKDKPAKAHSAGSRAAAGSRKARDPFDPAIFNRRYSGKDRRGAGPRPGAAGPPSDGYLPERSGSSKQASRKRRRAGK